MSRTPPAPFPARPRNRARRTVLALVALVPLVAAALVAAWPATARAQGVTVALGGAVLDHNAAIWQRLVALAGGPGSCYSVFATASSTPDASAARIVANLERHGAKAVHVRVAPRIEGLDLRAAVQEPRWIEQVLGCRGVFFSGGAQALLLDTLAPGGHESPLLAAVRQVWQRGGVVAGSSSGAAVLSAIAFRDAGDVQAVMRDPLGQGLREGREWARGFGFVPPQVIVDQHFVRRGRIGRLLPLMQARGVPLGLGVEEDSGALVRGSEVEAIGSAGVLVADLSGATREPEPQPFNLRGATLHWLRAGDRFDLATRRLLPAPPTERGTLLQPAAAGHRGYHAGVPFAADVLAEGLFVRLMARLVDSDAKELRGLSFTPGEELGFEWRLWVDEATRGWLNTQPESYTLAGVRLDIVPVRLPRRLYEPLPTRRAAP